MVDWEALVVMSPLYYSFSGFPISRTRNYNQITLEPVGCLFHANKLTRPLRDNGDLQLAAPNLNSSRWVCQWPGGFSWRSAGYNWSWRQQLIKSSSRGWRNEDPDPRLGGVNCDLTDFDGEVVIDVPNNTGRRTSGRVRKRTQVDGRCECDTEITKEMGTQLSDEVQSERLWNRLL